MAYKTHVGCSIEVLKTFAESSIDSIVTDPPYELGFMGKSWDASGIAFNTEVWREALRVLKPGGHLLAFSGSRTYHRMVVAIEDAGFEIRDQIMWVYGSGFPKSKNLDGDRKGWGTALKPAHEPIVLARKPLIGTVAANVLEHGTGTLNIDGCRVACVTVGEGNLALNPHLRSHINGGNGGNIIAHEEVRRVVTPNDLGRWPANLIHDGSYGVLEQFAVAGESVSRQGKPRGSKEPGDGWGMTKTGAEHSDSGTPARFFYCAKASKKDRGEGNNHPTVKPTELMRYLCRLITPPGGTVLDPFMGSGSTGKAALLEGFEFIGVDLSEGYVRIAESRLSEIHIEE